MVKNAVPEHSVLLQDHMHTGLDWILFADPLHVISADTAEDVAACLEEVERHLKQGYYVAGYLAYEASRGIDAFLHTRAECGYPVLWFGVYDNYRIFDISSIADSDFSLGEWEPNIGSEAYGEIIDTIKRHLRRGDTYQVNYTFRLRNSFNGDPLSLAKALFTAQSSRYCAYINLGDIHICSASPELFFEHADERVVSRPMKGTVKRGVSCADDNQRESWLKNSTKNRAENVMIVDMIRNDMGRFADAGSVNVDKLFCIERYPTVFQMTSTVSSKTRSTSVDVLRNMFPCASVTGAPKVRTMQLIHELETEPRGIYTGSIGYFLPDNQAQFNVAIRTVVVDMASLSAEYGVGGGIVWDSQAAEEYNECKIKARILSHPEPAFQLLESLFWNPAHGYRFLDRHLNRLAQAARYFDFAYSGNDIVDKLNRTVEGADSPQKVRLLVDRSGVVSIATERLSSLVGNLVCLAESGIDTQSGFVYHKTTNRRLYNEILALYDNVNDVIIQNEAGMITESCTANVVIKKGDHFITPAADAGLLDGVFRAQLLESEKIIEGCVTPRELALADEVYLINSVRGWMKLHTVERGRKWRITEVCGFDLDETVVDCEEYALNNMIGKII